MRWKSIVDVILGRWDQFIASRIACRNSRIPFLSLALVLKYALNPCASANALIFSSLTPIVSTSVRATTRNLINPGHAKISLAVPVGVHDPSKTHQRKGRY